MAGASGNFQEAGIAYPTPLIKVNGQLMIQTVVSNLNIEGTYFFLVQKSDYEKYNLKNLLEGISSNCKVIQIDHMTEGAACTVLKALKYIDNNEPLLIANSDQYIKWNSVETISFFNQKGTDGGILTFESLNPKHSFVKIGKNDVIKEVAEKKPISNSATVGIYYWKKGSDFVFYANQMIKKDIRTNNQFYVCPVYNEAINDGKMIKASSVDEMWGLGTPEELNTFLKNSTK